MNWVETLAEYYRLSRTGETQHWLCRRWLPQGRRVWPICGNCLSRSRRRSDGEQDAGAWPASLCGLAERYRRPTQQQQRQTDQQEHYDHFTEFVAHAFCCHVAPLTEVPPASKGDEEKRHQGDAVE